MMLSPLHNHRGMALLIALTIISLIVTLTLQFNRNMRQGLLASGISSNSVRTESMARSGITLAMLVLDEDMKDNTFDSPHDKWGLLADENLSSLFTTGSLHVRIIDESGKLQINSLIKDNKQQASPQQGTQKPNATQETSRNILWRLLRQEPFSLEDSKARTIIDSLIDWMDSDDGDMEQEFGAESSHYQSLTPPYACKNGPVESLEELLLVQGITPDLFYGTDKHPGLASLLTIQGNDGLINVNSAPPLLLQALSDDLTPEMTAELVSFREDKNNKEVLASPTWMTNVLPSLGGKNALKNITVVSRFFTIVSQAQINSTTRTITASVKRTNEKSTILSWKVE